MVRSLRIPAAIVLLAVLSGPALAAPPLGRSAQRAGRPRVLNYYLTNNVTPESLAQLARWDVLVLDADFPYENPEGMAQLRALHPGILLLAYIPSNGTSPTGHERPPETILHQHWQGCTDGDFWLYGVNGNPVSDWPGKWSANLTPHSPRNARGETYWEWFARFVEEAIWQNGQAGWDGLFLDDVWDRVSWINAVLASPIDGDRDGVPDAADSLDAGWHATNAALTARLRERLGPDVPIVANGENSQFDALNGTMIEDFPWNGTPDQGNPYGYAWRKWMLEGDGAYLRVLDAFNPHPARLTMLNARWSGTRAAPNRTARFAAHKRFCLGSALLGDGWFSLDASQDHASLWWEPEYDLVLGEPTGPAYTVQVGGLTVWRRDFEQGAVVVNPNGLPAQLEGLPEVGAWDAYLGGVASPVRDLPDDPALVIPPGFRVSAPYPNPGRGPLSLTLELGSAERVVIDVFDARGRLVATPLDSSLAAGRHEVIWDGMQDGHLLPAGVYLARIRGGGFTVTRKLHRLE